MAPPSLLHSCGCPLAPIIHLLPCWSKNGPKNSCLTLRLPYFLRELVNLPVLSIFAFVLFILNAKLIFWRGKVSTSGFLFWGLYAELQLIMPA